MKMPYPVYPDSTIPKQGKSTVEGFPFLQIKKVNFPQKAQFSLDFEGS